MSDKAEVVPTRAYVRIEVYAEMSDGSVRSSVKTERAPLDLMDGFDPDAKQDMFMHRVGGHVIDAYREVLPGNRQVKRRGKLRGV